MTTIKLKSGSGAPLASDLVAGEPALDLTNKRLYTEDSGGTVIEVGTNPTSLTTGTFTSTGIDDNATSTAITIDSSQNVGIGTASPSTLIEAQSTDARITLTYTGGNSLQLYQQSVSSYLFADHDLLIHTNGTERMRIDSSGNVGIGTTAPTEKLTVRGDVTLTPDSTSAADRLAAVTVGKRDSGTTGYMGQIDFVGSGTNGFATDIVFSSKTGDFFSSTTNEHMRIDSSGNVGIGGTPAATLDLFRSSGYPTIKINATGGANGWVSLQHGVTTGTSWLYSSGSLNLGSGGTAERVTINSSGDVGIGTTSPTGVGSYKILQVRGSSTSNGGLIRLETSDGTSGVARLYAGSGSTVLESNSNTPLVFGTNATERMRIDSSGNLLVGTTNINPSQNAVEGIALSAGSYGGYFSAARSGGAVAQLARLTSDGDILNFRNSTTSAGSIGVSSGDMYHGSGDTGLKYYPLGNAIHPYDPSTLANRDNAIDLGMSSIRFDDIYATNGTIQTSDINEKQDIEVLSDAEQRVAVAAKALLRKFRWKGAVEVKDNNTRSNETARIHFGIIAQDLQAAFEAEGLNASEYGMFTHSTWIDEETGEERSRMGVRYSELLAFIIAAI